MPILVLGFTVRNVSSTAAYSNVGQGAAWVKTVVTDPLARAVAAALQARGVPAVAANVSVSQVADVSAAFAHTVLFQAVDASFSPGVAAGRRRLGGAVAAAGPLGGAAPSVYVRAFVAVGDSVAAEAALVGAADLTAGALLLALRALAAPGHAGDPLSPAQYAFASVELGEVSVPPVIPWPSASARPPAAAKPFDPLLGLSVGQWVGVAFGVTVGVVLGSLLGYLIGQRNAPQKPPPKTRRHGRLRAKRLPGARAQGAPGAFVLDGAVARGDEEDEDEEEDGGEEEAEEADFADVWDEIPPQVAEKIKEKIRARSLRRMTSGIGAVAVAEDGSVGEMVNPMLRMKLKGKAPRRKAGAFAVTPDEAAPRVVAVMDAPRPIERVVFDFPITAVTNPYHLLYLGEPTFAAMIDKEVERATALAAVCRAAVDKLDEDMQRRRAALAKGGVAETTKSSRLLDAVSELAVVAQQAGHAASAEDVAARAAELQAYTVAKQDKAMAELRRAKYDELALDLMRLRNVIARVDEARLRVRSFQPKALTAFDPSSPFSGNERARQLERLQGRSISVRLPASVLEE